MAMRRSPVIRWATAVDVEGIWNLVKELAAFEKLSESATGDVDTLRRHLFGEKPYAEALVAESDGEIVGYCIFFTTFSTFRTAPGIWMEDLYVSPPYRGKGLGKAMLVRLSELAIERGCARHEWSVLDWNSAAIEFYSRLGASLLSDWRICRLEGEALTQVGSALDR